MLSAAATPEESPELASYLQPLRQIGRRTGELQSALASRPDIADFAPEPIGPQDIAAWTERLVERSNHTFDLLAEKRGGLAEADQALADRMLAVARGDRRPHPATRCRPTINAVKVRHHGDFHLGQVLVAKDDAFILDFEGEPGRSLAERRSKAPAARDVAGLIRSIDYSTTAALLNATSLTPEERNILHAEAGNLAREGRRGILERLPAGDRSGAVAGRSSRGAEPARFLPARKSVLRNGIRTDEPSGLAARSPRWHLAHPAAPQRGAANPVDA